MSDLMADGASLVADAISEHASQTVTYRRGGRDITGLKAARGRPTPAVDPTTGMLLNYVTVRWFIKPSLLVYGAETWQPQKNDLIIEADGAQWSLLPSESQNEHVLGSFGEQWIVESKRIKAPT